MLKLHYIQTSVCCAGHCGIYLG